MDEPTTFSNAFGLGTVVSLSLAVFTEMIYSIPLLLSFVIRLALIPLIGFMSPVGLHIDVHDPFAIKEKAIIFLNIYVFLFFTGRGKYSLDTMLSKKAVLLCN